MHLTELSPIERYTWVTGKEPLTYYDMNLSAQDHQNFFTCDTDALRPSDTGTSVVCTRHITVGVCKVAIFNTLQGSASCHVKYFLQ